jgi:nucleotide sugar dehydrogenase
MGHVGRMTADVLAHAAEVVTYDSTNSTPYPVAQVAACDFAVVCVNTPPLPSGGTDLQQVHQAIAALPGHIPVVLRSTVPPGTSDSLADEYDRELIFWPEYVGETRFAAQTWERFRATNPFQVFGARTSTTTTTWLDLVAEAYGPLVRLVRLAPSEAELVKYMENSWFAVKVTFVNEFRRVAEALGLEWRAVREGWLLDPRIERDHSDAFASNPGYGGKCLPKDVAGILSATADLGIAMPLLSCVERINAENTLPNRGSEGARRGLKLHDKGLDPA